MQGWKLGHVYEVLFVPVQLGFAVHPNLLDIGFLSFAPQVGEFSPAV